MSAREGLTVARTLVGLLARFLAMGCVKKTISLPRDLAKEAEEIARGEGKTLSAVVQDALRAARRARLETELRTIQGFWSRKARKKGLLREQDLEIFMDRLPESK